MNPRDYFKIFKEIKHQILEEEHDFKELLADQVTLHATLQTIASGTKTINYQENQVNLQESLQKSQAPQVNSKSLLAPPNNVNIYSRESLFDLEQDLLNKTMDHFAPSAKKKMSKYKGSHSQKNMLTMKQMKLAKERPYRPPRPVGQPPNREVLKLKKDLNELKDFKEKYLDMEQKMNNLEKMMKMERSNPVFFSTIQQPMDYEMQQAYPAQPDQPLMKQKIKRGSSYGERRMPGNPVNQFKYQQQLQLQHQQQLHHQHQSLIKEYPPLRVNQREVHEYQAQLQEEIHNQIYSQRQNQVPSHMHGKVQQFFKMSDSEERREEERQNVFYDNNSKSSSPLKQDQPKLMSKGSKQLSFSNINSEQNLSNKRSKGRGEAENVQSKNKPRSMITLATEEDALLTKSSSRVPKNLKQHSKMKHSDPGRLMRKRGSNAGKKKVNAQESYKGVPTKRRVRKTNFPKEELFLNKSYKTQNKQAQYSTINKKKTHAIEADPRKMGSYFDRSPQKEEDKNFSKYGVKLARTMAKESRTKDTRRENYTSKNFGAYQGPTKPSGTRMLRSYRYKNKS